jgi:hypothetical protein
VSRAVSAGEQGQGGAAEAQAGRAEELAAGQMLGVFEERVHAG